MKGFEIITSSGVHFRWDIIPDISYRWQYQLLPKSIDEVDHSIVEVYKLLEGEEEEELAATVCDVIAAGDIDTLTALCMPRLRLTKQCPICNYIEPESK